MPILNNKQTKAFLLGLSAAAIVIVSFFAGAIADRLFVIQPLDYFLKERAPQIQQYTQSQRSSLVLPKMGEQSIADIAQTASPSVVTISLHTTQRTPSYSLEDLFRRRFFNIEQELEEIQKNIGTGFVVTDQGLIVTNKHVIADTEAIYYIIDKDDNEYEVQKIYRDPANDLAILQIQENNLTPLKLGDSDQVAVGEWVVAIGTALGEFRHTVTAGVVSGLGRGITASDAFGNAVESLENVIQTDAAINPGNSGGPLLNLSGEVIGINTAVTTGAENIGFAIPINVVKASLENFNETGQFDRPFLGIRYQIVSQRAAIANEIPQGAYITEIIEGSAAEEAGLQQGDIILSIDGQEITEETNLAEIINQKKVGDRVTLRIYSVETEERTTITAILKSSQN